jgi:hypothetical protein
MESFIWHWMSMRFTWALVLRAAPGAMQTFYRGFKVARGHLGVSPMMCRLPLILFSLLVTILILCFDADMLVVSNTG